MISFSNLSTKMKALYGSVGAVVGAGAIALGTMFFGGNDAYVNTIPKTADVVIRMNVADLAEGSGLNSEEGKKILKKLTDMAGSDASSSELLKRIQEDPSSLGLRLDKDAYAFAELEKGEECGALVVGMLSEDNFKESVTMLFKETNTKMEIVEKEGMKWIESKNAGENVAMAYDSDMLIFSYGDRAKSNILRWKGMGSDERYCKTTRWDKLQGVGGQFAVDFNYGSIPVEKEAEDLMMQMYGIRTKDLSVAMSLDVKKGEASMNTEVYSENERFTEKMKQSLDCVSTIDGVYAETAPENYVMWMGLNLHGEKILNMLKGMDTIKDAIAKVESGIGIKFADFFNDIDGDMAFCVTSDKVSNAFIMPTVHFNTQVKNEKYLQNVLNIMNGKVPVMDQYVQKKGNDYDIKFDGATVASMGVKDGKNLFITNAPAPYSTKTSALSSYMSDIKSSTAFYIVNFPNTEKLFTSLITDELERKLAVDIVKQFGVAFMKTSKDGKCSATLKFKNDGDYVISIISNIFDIYMKNQQERSEKMAELDIYEYNDDNEYDEIDSVAVDEDLAFED